MCVYFCMCASMCVCVICCRQVKRMRTENSWSQWCSYQLAADATFIAGLTLIPSKPSGTLLHPSTPLYHHNPWDLLYWQLDWIRLQQPVSLMLLNGHFHSHGPLSCHSPWCCRVRVWPAHLFVTAIGIRNRTQAVAWILPYGLYGQRE